MSVRMKQIGLVCSVLGMACSIQAAVLDTAVAYWEMAAASSGTVTAAQVIDSTIPSYSTYSVWGSPVWTTCPTAGPGGITTDGRAITFNNTSKGIQIENNQYQASGAFTDALYATGSITLWTRINISNSTTYAWDTALPIMTHCAWDSKGFTFSMRGRDSSSYVAPSFQLCFNGFSKTISPTTLNIATGQWADIGVSYDATTSTGLMTVCDNQGWRTLAFDWDGAGSARKATWNNFYLASGLGYLNGNMESAAAWNIALNETELKTMSVVPEPITLVLLGLGVAIFRKKHN